MSAELEPVLGQLADYPGIPVGLATRVGQIVGAAFAIIAAVTAVLHGDHTEETITAMILSAVTFVTLMRGRYDQAAAKLKAPATLAVGEVNATPPAGPPRT